MIESSEERDFKMSTGKESMNKRALVLGGGGFIGGHLVRRLKREGYWVRSVDLKVHEYGVTADDFIQGDLTNPEFCSKAFKLKGDMAFDRIYQLAADMGGAGYIFSGENDANLMTNSSLINLNVLQAVAKMQKSRLKSITLFYSSSACIYPEELQSKPENLGLRENDAYPANPDSEYGWEKLFSERLYLAFARNYDLDIRIARFHNIFGPEGTWKGGREKAPAAICRKVIEGKNGGSVEIWGDGKQTRSFLFIDDCLEAVERLMKSRYKFPLNIGSNNLVSIRQLVEIINSFEGKKLKVISTQGPQGVRGRSSNNDLLKEVLGWEIQDNLDIGLKITYEWIREQMSRGSISS